MLKWYSLLKAPHIFAILRDQMLETQLKDNVRARVMQNDGTYIRLKPPSEDKAVDVQEFFMRNYRSKNY